MIPSAELHVALFSCQRDGSLHFIIHMIYQMFVNGGQVRQCTSGLLLFRIHIRRYTFP